MFTHTALARCDDRHSILSYDTDKPTAQSFSTNSFILVLTCISTPKYKGKGVSWFLLCLTDPSVDLRPCFILLSFISCAIERAACWFPCSWDCSLVPTRIILTNVSKDGDAERCWHWTGHYCWTYRPSKFRPPVQDTLFYNPALFQDCLTVLARYCFQTPATPPSPSRRHSVLGC